MQLAESGTRFMPDERPALRAILSATATCLESHRDQRGANLRIADQWESCARQQLLAFDFFGGAFGTRRNLTHTHVTVAASPIDFREAAMQNTYERHVVTEYLSNDAPSRLVETLFLDGTCTVEATKVSIDLAAPIHE